MASIALFDRSETSDVVELLRSAGLVHPWNDSERDIELALAHPTNRIFVARDDAERIVGTVMVGFDGHRGWIYSLAVTASQRGHGTGRQLIARAEEWLREQRAPVVRLLVADGNEAALSFYEACGYERADLVPFGKRLIG